MIKKVATISKFLLIFAIVTAWIFSGWPRIWQNPPIPPEIQEAWAAVPTYQAFSAIEASTGVDVTVTLPAHAANDIFLIEVIVRDVNDTITWPSGWTQIATVDRGTTARYWWAWKRAASASETNPLVDKSTATGDTYAAVITYRGAARTGDPWEVKGTAQTGTTDPSVLTGITTLSAESLVVAAMAGEDNNNASIITTGTDPAAYTEHYVESSTGADGVITFSEAARTAAGATGNVSVNWNSAVPVGWGGILLALIPPRVTTLGDGTDPGNSTVAPDSSITDLDAFTLKTDYSTDSITALTVTLSAGTYVGLSEVRITSSDGSTTYFSAVAPSADTVNFSGGSIPVTTTATTFKVRITPKTHANMPAPPGAQYAVTGTVTSYTSNNDNDKTGTDTDSATITIDNASPGDATWGTITPGDQQIVLNWTNPGDADFNKVLILRKAGSAVEDAPTEGTEYSVPGTIGASTIIYVGNDTTFTDTGLTNGTNYYYKIFAYDTYINYASGADTGPHTPVVIPSVTLSLQTYDYSGNETTGTVNFGDLDPETTPSVTIRDNLGACAVETTVTANVSWTYTVQASDNLKDIGANIIPIGNLQWATDDYLANLPWVLFQITTYTISSGNAPTPPTGTSYDYDYKLTIDWTIAPSTGYSTTITYTAVADLP